MGYKRGDSELSKKERKSRLGCLLFRQEKKLHTTKTTPEFVTEARQKDHNGKGRLVESDSASEKSRRGKSGEKNRKRNRER